VAYVLSVITD